MYSMRYILDNVMDLKPRWCGDNVFKIRRNEGRDTTLVFHIDYIQSYEVRYDHSCMENNEVHSV